MKYTVTLACLCLLFLNAPAAGNKAATLARLSEVNSQWLNQPERWSAIPATVEGNATYNDWIATHLMLVEQVLRSRSAGNLTPVQQQRRTALLDKLNSYWRRGQFPINSYTNYKTPVFIDDAGTHCAVGYLMQQSGAEALARQINLQQPLAYVFDIKVKGVEAWARTNGFTVAELAWIQPAYIPAVTYHSLNGGLNGAVTTMVTDTTAHVVYAGGDFTGANNGVNGNHVMAWTGADGAGAWSNVGAGVNGPVQTLALHNNQLYAGGNFSLAGSAPAGNAAVYNISQQQWQALGSLDSTVRSLCFYKNELYAGGDFTGNVAKWTGSAWQTISAGLIAGSVHTLQVWDTLLVIGGHFDILTGAPRKNAILYDGTQLITMGIGGPNPVNDFEVFNGSLYAACRVVQGTDTCAIARYTDNGWEIILKPQVGFMDFFNGPSVNALMAVDSTLYIAGDFACSTGMTMGNNLMKLHYVQVDTLIYPQYLPLGALDSACNTLGMVGGRLYFGGEFSTSQGGLSPSALGHIAYIATSPEVGIHEATPTLRMPVYPNPTATVINYTLPGGITNCSMQITALDGRLVMQTTVYSPTGYVDVAALPAGWYMVKATTGNKACYGRFLKL